MSETTPLDRRLLRALRRPTHAYALARESDADRATVYRRVAKLQADGLVASRPEPGRGARRKTLRLAPAGEEALRAELRDALRLLLEAFDASARGDRSGRGGAEAKPPIVFASGSRVSGVELRIVRHLAREHPRAVHLVVPPGCDVDTSGVPTMEGTWRALPFRDAFARTLFVNELPPARGLAHAAHEWARVLQRGGHVHVVAPAPLPRGVDPFVDWFADLQDELFPDQRDAPAASTVTAALAARFRSVRSWRQGTQVVWTARAP